MRQLHTVVLTFLLIGAAGCSREVRPAPDAAPPPAAQSTLQDVGAIEGVDWQWVRTVTPVGVTEPAGGKYTLRLEGGTASGNADCNRFTTHYTLEGKALRFGPVAMTKMMCSQGSLGDRYARHFEYIRSYFTAGDTLFMDQVADAGTLRFVRAVAP